MALRLVPHLGTVSRVYRAKPPSQAPDAAAPIRAMRPSEFAEALDLIGWSRAQAAERLHQLPVTVRKWASGHAAIPDTVAAWLRPYAAEAAALHARHPPPRRVGRATGPEGD